MCNHFSDPAHIRHLEMPAPAEVGLLVELFKSGRLVELEQTSHSLLEKYPDSGLLWKVLGVSLQFQGKDALPAMEKAVALSPEDAEVHGNIGNVLRDRGQFDKAIAHFRRAIEIRPSFAEAHNNLGNVLRDLGCLDEALASYRSAVGLNPHLAEAYSNLGNVLRTLGQLEEAVLMCRHALMEKPNFAEAHCNLGNALRDMGLLDDAVASYQLALEIKPDYPGVLNNFGNVLYELGQVERAAVCYKDALAINPNYAEAHSNLGNVLRDAGRIAEAVASYRRALEIHPEYDGAHSNLLFAINSQTDISPSKILAAAKDFGGRVARKVHPYTSWGCSPKPSKRLRIGFVSGDLREHPVGYFLEGVLKALVAEVSDQLEVFAYATHFGFDGLTERIKALCSGWLLVAGFSDENLAQRIHDDGIDVLIDLSGHTAYNRLPMFAWKPAPIQASWLGYLGTTGVGAIDYLIADSWTVPDTDEVHFSETIQFLPETYLCFTPPDIVLDVSPLPATNNGYVTFGCFNNLSKINDEVISLWARILSAVPQSRLLLKTRQFKNVSMRRSVAERFAVHGITAQRLLLEGFISRRDDHLRAYHQVDIALDPFPYPGITTSVEALWMGVPVLTMEGDRFMSRQGAGLLKNVGLPEWIAANAEDYAALAIQHSGDLQGLAALRTGLRRQVVASPIFDAPRFAHHFEAMLRRMWVKWCDQQLKV